jgi:hemolysin activation/secretion protein
VRAAALAALLLLATGPAWAQVFDRPADQRPELPAFEEPSPTPLPTLPPIAIPEPDPGDASAGPRFFVHGYRITGSTAFSKEELHRVVGPYIDRELGSEQLVALRNAVTQLYVEHGYINSGALIPDQDLAGGLIEIRVVEGSLEGIEIRGAERFRASRLRDRVAQGLSTPLDVESLELNLQLLQQDPRIERLHARLLPGERIGEAVLIVRVEEASPYDLDFEVSNYSPVAFGSYRGRLFAAHRNLVGLGDTLDARLTVSEGLLRVDGQYELPLNARGTLLRLRGEYSDSEVVEEPFDALDIETEYWSARIFVEHPVYRSLRSRLLLGLMVEWRRSETCFNLLKDLIGCDPFSGVASGAVDGRTTVSVLRLTGDWAWRDQRQVLAARSMLSVGVPVLGARSGGVRPDGEFVAWLGQVQWARRYGRWGIQTILRADAQVTSDALPALERFPVGGHMTVRGYRENQLVRDQGAVASAEVRVPLWRAGEGRPILEIAPFFDFGYSQNKNRETLGPDWLASVGVGLRWAVTRRLAANVYWGHQIKDVRTFGDLQDDGVQFEVRWDAF